MSARADCFGYFTLYTRSPWSLRMDSTVSFIFFETVPEIKPRIVCGCHFVNLAISAAVAPSLRRSNWITSAGGALWRNGDGSCGGSGICVGHLVFLSFCSRLEHLIHRAGAVERQAKIRLS